MRKRTKLAVWMIVAVCITTPSILAVFAIAQAAFVIGATVVVVLLIAAVAAIESRRKRYSEDYMRRQRERFRFRSRPD